MKNHIREVATLTAEVARLRAVCDQGSQLNADVMRRAQRAEAQLASLNAEVERVTGLARATAEAADKLLAKLAAANALLVRVTNGEGTCDTAGRTVAAEQRVLDAMADVPTEWLEDAPALAYEAAFAAELACRAVSK
jgi:predicted phage gp36 major capsid-like protein